MLSPVTMKRLGVVVLERDERAVLRMLGRLGAVHLVRTGAGPDTAPQQPPDRSAELAQCDGLLARIDSLGRQLELGAVPEPAGEPPEVALDQADERLKTLEDRAADLLNRRQSVQQRWGQVTALLDQVTGYVGLELPLEQIGQFTFLHFAVGALPEGNLEDLQEKVGDNVVLLPVRTQDGRTRLVAVTSRKGRFALETALEETGFRREPLQPAGAGTMEDVTAQAREEQGRLAEELKALGEATRGYAREAAAPLGDLRSIVRVERQILEAEQNFPRTDATVLVTGWVAADEVPALRRHLQHETGGRCVVETTDPDDVPEEEVPVLLRHSRLLRPFEMLVVGYGLPGYRELEPTLFVALTFVFMFGFMFGDVGHGGVLAAGGLLALLLGRSDKVRDVGILLLCGGGSSVLFGVMYGSYFGFQGWALWHDPLARGSDPLQLMLVVLVVGVLIISLGLVLNTVNRFRRGDVVGGFLDRFGVAGAILYWGALALVLKFLAFRRGEHPWMDTLLLVLLPLALVTVLLKEPIQYAVSRRAGRPTHAANIFEAFLESAIEAFEAVLTYMANTMSFIRLMAYAMSHAAILMATLFLAKEIRTAVGAGIAGGAAGVVVLVIGNVLAILLEGIIAAVQALRLEYYEFFSKFFTGSGRAFKPFRFATKPGDSLPQGP